MWQYSFRSRIGPLPLVQFLYQPKIAYFGCLITNYPNQPNLSFEAIFDVLLEWSPLA